MKIGLHFLFYHFIYFKTIIIMFACPFTSKTNKNLFDPFFSLVLTFHSSQHTSISLCISSPKQNYNHTDVQDTHQIQPMVSVGVLWITKFINRGWTNSKWPTMLIHSQTGRLWELNDVIKGILSGQTRKFSQLTIKILCSNQYKGLKFCALEWKRKDCSTWW